MIKLEKIIIEIIKIKLNDLPLALLSLSWKRVRTCGRQV